MALSAGTRLGPYEILAPLGAGGMGEVYRAKDTRLHRTVAIKVLPSHLSARPELQRRLEREAKTISQLSHPHICTLHDVGREGETDFLVMEYLEGETLAHRLEKGPLPLEQALRTASEIADALDKAHRQGVVHRDLKPGNVMLTKSGAKLLDFGLAKLRGAGLVGEVTAGSALPTEARPLTEEGKIVGTYPYMAPEQLEGEKVDPRTDIFAFGAVLYEMVTGKRAFEGKSRASLIAAILSSEPRPIGELEPMTPPLLDRVVKRCLTKDRDERWQSAGDLAAELRWIGEASRDGTEPFAGAVSGPSPRTRLGGMAAAVVLVALVAFWLGTGQRSEDPVSGSSSAPVTHTLIELPPEAPLALGGAAAKAAADSSAIALSPDGSRLVYVADTGEGTELFLRSMESLEVRPIPGTEGAVHPFFSPDGRWVGFLTNDKVKKVSLQGGAPQTLCDVPAPARASWTADDTIYVAENFGLLLVRVPAGGGEPTRVAESFTGTKFGQVLPDGQSVLVADPRGGASCDHNDTLLLSLETLETSVLIESGCDARYVPTGHLLFARSGSLFAVGFDLERLEVLGEPAPIASGVSMESFWAQAQVAVSDSGSFAFVPGGDVSEGRLAWVDRNGRTESLPVRARLYGGLDLAPGGGRLAIHVSDVQDYIWVYDLHRQEGRRLTVAEEAGYPLWTPDGASLAFTAWGRGEPWRILRRAVDASDEPEELFADAQQTIAWSWSPDGRVLALGGEGFFRIGLLPTSSPGQPVWFEGGTYLADFSPDGRWVAYTSPETGRAEVWVRSYPDDGKARQISVEGGAEPVWCQECDELFYWWAGQWMSVSVTLEPDFAWGSPRLAFETDLIDTPGRSYDVSPDGQRLLVVKRTRTPARTKIHLVQNWFENLDEKTGRDGRTSVLGSR